MFFNYSDDTVLISYVLGITCQNVNTLSLYLVSHPSTQKWYPRLGSSAPLLMYVNRCLPRRDRVCVVQHSWLFTSAARAQRACVCDEAGLPLGSRSVTVPCFVCLLHCLTSS